MKRLLLFLLAPAVIIAGCGGGSKTSTIHTSAPPVKTVQGHQCSPQNEALQCILPPAPPQRRGAPRAGVTLGVDFAWGAPYASHLKAGGWRFGASYISYDQSKGWQQRQGLVNEYHSAGLGTVAVWETTASRAAQGCLAGKSDALEAARKARQIGNATGPIDFAIDFDASGEQVAPYFLCARTAIGPRVGAYGGYYPLKYLCARGIVNHTNWQTYAWSSGHWLDKSCAPLEQYLNDNSVDYDRALATNYGQWPAPAVVSNTALRARQRTLRRVLLHYGCRHRKSHHEHLGPRCLRWFIEGDRVGAELRRNV